jgi:cytochrome c peroxidase
MIEFARVALILGMACGSVMAAEPPAMTARARLGRFLFYDKRMSVNGTASCATCHRQELAFTDGRAQALGATGQLHPRGAMSLVNVVFNGAFNWSDPSVHSLEEQALKPMFSEAPVELGFGSVKAAFIRMIRTDLTYRALFQKAFPNEHDAYIAGNIARALSVFERTIVSTDSPYDRFHHGDRNAISEAAKRGEILFFQDGGPSCFRCHSGINFSDSAFHNTGLYDLPGQFSYPVSNLGLYEHTKRAADIGKFRTPGLRNIALTAPYMHDGSIATLEEVVDHYAAGGRGRGNPNKDRLIRGFRMTPRNRADLVAFLTSLTDQTVLQSPEYSDPWPG